VDHFYKHDGGARGSGLIQTFANCQIFRNLSLGEIKEISSRATPAHYERGSFIFEIGDPANYLYIMEKGSVKLHNMSPSGKGVTFEISKAGDTLNGSALSTGTYFVSAQALTDVTVLRIARNEFFGFVAKYPNLAMEIIHLLSARLKTEYKRMAAIQREEVEQRVCRSLVALASKFGTTLSMKREELADYTGTATETTIRVLGRLKRAGIVGCSAHKGEIVIADMDKLRAAIVDTDDPR
jgi:CRP/FNR family transcriptional regulator